MSEAPRFFPIVISTLPPPARDLQIRPPSIVCLCVPIILQCHTTELSKQISALVIIHHLLLQVQRVRLLHTPRVHRSHPPIRLRHNLVLCLSPSLILIRCVPTGGRVFRNRPQLIFANHLCCFTSLAPLRLPSRVFSFLSNSRVIQSLPALFVN